jgi:hypothetical protein
MHNQGGGPLGESGRAPLINMCCVVHIAESLANLALVQPDFSCQRRDRQCRDLPDLAIRGSPVSVDLPVVHVKVSLDICTDAMYQQKCLPPNWGDCTDLDQGLSVFRVPLQCCSCCPSATSRPAWSLMLVWIDHALALARSSMLHIGLAISFTCPLSVRASAWPSHLGLLPGPGTARG